MPLFPSAFARRTVTLLLAAALALLGIVGASLWLVERTRDHADEVQAAQEMRLRAFRVLSLLQDAETGQRGYLLTSETPYLEPYERARARLAEELSALAAAIGNGREDGEALRRLREIANAKLAELAETVSLTGAGRTSDALAIVRSDRGKQLMDDARALIDGLIARSDARLGARLADLQWTSGVLRWVSIFGGLLIAAFAAGSALTVMRHTRDLVAARREVDAMNIGLESRVRERTADLARANEEIQRFAYIVSHDLRAPLVNIMGFTSELEGSLASLRRYLARRRRRTTPCSPATHERRVERGPARGDRLHPRLDDEDGRLINAILKLSREGRRRLTPRARRPRQRCSTPRRRDPRTSSTAAGGEIDDRTADCPSIVSDRLALEQVFGNLVDNAVKYLDRTRPGRIVVRGRQERPARS